MRLSAQDAIEWPRQSLRVPSDLAGHDSTDRGLRVLYRRRLAHQPVNWYLWPAGRCRYPPRQLFDGHPRVHAQCGVEFVPRELPLGAPG
jgi:hypothetical protein